MQRKQTPTTHINYGDYSNLKQLLDRDCTPRAAASRSQIRLRRLRHQTPHQPRRRKRLATMRTLVHKLRIPSAHLRPLLHKMHRNKTRALGSTTERRCDSGRDPNDSRHSRSGRIDNRSMVPRMERKKMDPNPAFRRTMDTRKDTPRAR